MIRLLARIFIRESNTRSDTAVRLRYGILTGAVGIFLNVCLFLMKWAAGTVTGSISITADAFNNLSDAGTSAITLFGFRMAAQKPDKEHPFGHGRMEYISGLLVSVAILIMGFELIKESVTRIIHPQETVFDTLAVVFLVISILVKLYMYWYNHSLGKQLDSPAMEATAMDSVSDAVSTTAVLLVSILAKITGLHLDGWMGTVIGVLIFITGIRTLKSTADPLLGQAPDRDFINKVEEIATSHSLVSGVHDITVHNYGPDNVMVTFHAEVPADGDIQSVHEQIDHIEHEMSNRLHCSVLIHMDPIVTDDEEALSLKQQVQEMAAGIDPFFHVHDFRLVHKESFSKVLFDLEVPYSWPESDKEIIGRMREQIAALPGHDYKVLIQVDRTSDQS
ncbi:MAG: cation transporter [Blautia sp.]|nr:cation transporter [Blautia sp.]